MRIIIFILMINIIYGINYVLADTLDPEINSNTTVNNENIILNQNVDITNSAQLSFTNGSVLTINSGFVINNEGIDPSPIIVDSSTINLNKGSINSIINLNNSILNAESGYIQELGIGGKSNVLVNNTHFDTLDFLNTLGEIKSGDGGINLNNITINKLLNIDFTSMTNDVDRIVNFQDSDLGIINIKGEVDHPLDSSNNPTKLTTNFNIIDSTINVINYVDSNAIRENFVSKGYGELNLTNTSITTLNVSFNLLRNIVIDGGEITNFNIVDPVSRTDPYQNAPNAPKYSDLQMLGKGVLTIDNMNLGMVPSINIEGEDSADSFEGSMSNIYIPKLTGYDENTKVSLYDLKNVIIGQLPTGIVENIQKIYKQLKQYNCTNPSKDNLSVCASLQNGGIDPNNFYNPDDNDAKDDYLPTKSISGGENPTININYLNKVTNLQLYNQTVKFTMPADTTSNNTQLYNLSSLKLYNSLIDVSGTQSQPYDLDFEYQGISSNTVYTTVFYFFNSGVKGADTLRLKVNGNYQFIANDISSNLFMDIHGEGNVFALKSDANKKNYQFNTNYDFCLIKPAYGNQRQNCISLLDSYDYWNIEEDKRIENNIYYLNSDTIIAPLTGVKDKYGNIVNGTMWFTYSQPYSTDTTDKIQDQCAVDEQTDGSGRGGFPCEFGSKIQINNGTTTFLKHLDNLTVLEIAGSGIVNLADMDSSQFASKWLSKLRMRSGTLYLGTNNLIIDNLELYSYKDQNSSVLRLSLNGDTNPTSGRIIINKDANFNNNYINMDLFFNKDFINLNTPITLDILDLGAQATQENFKGILFNQGIMFDNSYYWENNHLYVTIKRIKNFNYWLKGVDIEASKFLDSIINNPNYQININGNTQNINNNSNLSVATIKIINQLFKSQSTDELKNYFISLRPISNQSIFEINNISLKNILSFLENKNYITSGNSNHFNIWFNTSFASNLLSDNDTSIGANINANSYVIGADWKFYNIVIGTLLGYSNNDFSSSYYEGSDKVISTGLYSNINLSNNYYLNLSGISSISNYKGARQQYFIQESSQFSIKAQDIRSNLKIGKKINILDSKFDSFITGGIGIFKDDDYQEDTSASAALEVKGFSNLYYNLGIGFNLSKDIKIDQNSFLKPNIGLIYNYYYFDNDTTQARFINVNGYTSNSLINYYFKNIDSNLINFNVGCDYFLTKNSIFSFNFNALAINRDLSGYSVSFGYRYNF